MPRNTFILTKIFNFIVRKLMVLSPACLECILTSIHLFISIFSVRTTSQVESEGPPTCQVHRVWLAVCRAESPPIRLLPHSGPLTSTPKSFSHQSAHLLQRPFQRECLHLSFTCLCSQTHTNLADRKLNVSTVQSRKKTITADLSCIISPFGQRAELLHSVSFIIYFYLRGLSIGRFFFF